MEAGVSLRDCTSTGMSLGRNVVPTNTRCQEFDQVQSAIQAAWFIYEFGLKGYCPATLTSLHVYSLPYVLVHSLLCTLFQAHALWVYLFLVGKLLHVYTHLCIISSGVTTDAENTERSSASGLNYPTSWAGGQVVPARSHGRLSREYKYNLTTFNFPKSLISEICMEFGVSRWDCTTTGRNLALSNAIN